MREAYHIELDQLADELAEMSVQVANAMEQATKALLEADLTLAEQVIGDDSKIDDIHRYLFSVIMAKDWEFGVPAAVDVTLLGRFYERYADHAVSVAKRIVFVATGRLPGSDSDTET